MDNLLILSLGSNIGDKKTNIENAIRLLDNKVGEVLKVSSFYETEAWGNSDLNSFLNIALTINTTNHIVDCWELIIEIQKEMGREPKTKKVYQNRIIDIDILFYNQEIIDNGELVVPHCKLQERNFVLKPLKEIEPYFNHPVINENISELTSRCLDQLKVKKLE